MTIRNPLFLLGVTHILIWSVLAFVFYNVFEAKSLGLWVHFAILSLWLLSGLFLSLALLKNTPMFIIRTFVGLLSFVPLALYGFKFTGNLLWDRDMTQDIVISYLGNFREIIQASLSTPGGFIGLLVSFLLVLGYFVFFLSWKSLTDSLKELDLNLKVARFKTPLYLLISCMLWGFLGYIFHLGANNEIFDDEPLLSFIFPHDSIGPSTQTSAIRSPFLSSKERLEYVPHTDKPKRNVIIILSDALRADHMGVYGYERNTTPWLSELYKNPNVQKVDTNYSMCSETICGVYSTLTSISPAENYISTFSLPYIFSEQHYKINFIMSGMAKDYYELKSLVRTSAVDFIRDGHDCITRFNDDECVLENMDKLPDSDGNPSFTYIHILSTHQLGLFHDEKFAKFGANQKNPLYNQPADIYDDKVLQADDYFRRIVNKLKDKGYLQDSIVIFTGDHGEALGEHGLFHHLKKVYPEFIHIPLIWWDTNGTTALKQTHYGAQVDLAPTILDALGYQIPKTWTGISLLQPETPTREVFHRTILRTKGENCFAISGYNALEINFIHQCLGGDPQVFNINKDPMALHPIPKQEWSLIQKGYWEDLQKSLH